MREPKVLFIIKRKKINNNPDDISPIHSGLSNSADFVNQMLKKNNVESNLVQVGDNNDIDREVTKYKPTHVIIEAIWVVPDKFEILNKLHPDVIWIIRVHSEIPFISNEGNAMEWIFGYSKISNDYNIRIAPNTIKMCNDLTNIGVNNVIFLPNYYGVTKKDYSKPAEKDHVNIGCFGAIRPMKNQLIQAIAAIDFGNKIGKPMFFHVNGGRIERGETVIRNLRGLFDNQTEHKLVEHGWYTHEEFLGLVSKMDFGLQVSFNETFNIVAADMVSENIPIIGSDEIAWLHPLYKAKTTSTDSIVDKLLLADLLKGVNGQKLNKFRLINFSKKSQKTWLEYLKKG